MSDIQPPRYDLIERNNADARAQAAQTARKVVNGIDLNDAIAAVKQQYGFSDQAWDILTLTIDECAEEGATLERYREREDKIEEILREVGECWVCGSATRGQVHHDEECPPAPVETCGAPVDDPFGTEPMPCSFRKGHEGKHWPE